jgi:hypothetical protein
VIITEDGLTARAIDEMPDAELIETLNLLLSELESRGGRLALHPHEAPPDDLITRRLHLSPGAETALEAADPGLTQAIPRSVAEEATRLAQRRASGAGAL